MPLKIELKPHERIVIGKVVIRNSETRARFFVEGNAPILREKDIVTEETADTLAKKIYLAVELMYLADNITQYHEIYFELVHQFLEAAPSALPIIAQMNNQILIGELYKGLKTARRLIQYEAELMTHATRG
jgi:flagellar protein FlbT